MSKGTAPSARPAEARELLSALEASEGMAPAHLRDLAARLVAEVEARRPAPPEGAPDPAGAPGAGGFADRAASAMSRALRAARMSPSPGGAPVAPVDEVSPPVPSPQAGRPRDAFAAALAEASVSAEPKPRAIFKAPPPVQAPLPTLSIPGRLTLALPEPLDAAPDRAATIPPPVLSRNDIASMVREAEQRCGLMGEHPMIVALGLSGRSTLEQAAALRRLPRAEQRSVHKALRQIERV